MGIDDNEKFLVVLVEARGRSLEELQVWGPFDTHAEAKEWILSNMREHLDPFEQHRGVRFYRINRLINPMYP